MEQWLERRAGSTGIAGSIPDVVCILEFFSSKYFASFWEARKIFLMQFVENWRENAKKREKRNSSNFVVRKNGIGGAKCNFSS